MMIISKVPQIITIFNHGSTGNLAFITFLLNFLGIIARFATVIIESDDFMLHLQNGIALFLNTVFMIQFAMYWNSNDAEAPTAPAEGKKKTSVYEKVNSKPAKRNKIE